MKSINKLDLFSPYIFPVMVFLYVLFGFIGFTYKIKNLNPPSPLVYLYVFGGTLFFIMGVLSPKLLVSLRNNHLNNIIDNIKSTKEQANIFDFKKIIWKDYSKLELLLVSVVIIGLLLQAINIMWAGGIPLFSGYLKAHAVTKIWILSYVLFLPGINILLAKFSRKYYYFLFVLGMILFALTGYRTTTIAIVLSVFITSYYTKDFFSKNNKWIYILLFLALIVVMVLIVGYVAVKSIEWQQWSLNPLELFFYRAGYTLTVFGELLKFQGQTHGALLYYSMMGFFESQDPRVIVGTLVLGYKHSATSTIFGPVLLDFGVIALAIQMFFLGFVLRTMYFIQKYKKGIFTAFYAIILAQTIIWIETGPTDLVVFIFYFISILLILGTFYNSYVVVRNQ